MLKELIIAQFCYTCTPPPWLTPPPPPPPPPACPTVSQVTNPALCRQARVSYVVDGCSIPEQVATVLGDRNNPVNGLVGFTSTAFGVEQGTVHWLLVSNISSLPCNRHDRCYKTCGSSQASCDQSFGSDLRGVCARAYPNVVDCPRFLPPFNAPARCAQYQLESVRCSTIATAMTAAVALAGQPAFRANQERHCDCCNVT